VGDPTKLHGPLGRWRLAWRALRDHLPEEQRVRIVSRKRDRYRRRLRYQRVWRRRLHWIDPGKPPLAVARWFAVLGLALAWWVNGAPVSVLHKWVPYVIIAGALMLPDIAGFTVGGLRVDMREAEKEIAQLRQDVNAQARASSVAAIAIGDQAIREVIEPIVGAVLQALGGQAGGAAVPWPLPDSEPPVDQSTASPDRT
jgi:hypothetical protein